MEFLRDLDLEDLEQRQLQIDRDNDPSRHAEAEVVAARETAIAALEMEISAAHKNNDFERAQWLRCIFIYSGSARLVSFELKLISKEVSRA